MMKKFIALSTLFAISSVAVAQGFNDPNDARTQKVEPPRHEMPHHEKGRMHKGKHPEKDEHRKGEKREFKPPFFDENQAVKSVKAVADAKDKAFVMLEGKITKQVGKEDFLFQDATGQIEVEISRHAWLGETITPNDTVELRGFVDKEWDKTEVEIKQVIKKTTTN